MSNSSGKRGVIAPKRGAAKKAAANYLEVRDPDFDNMEFTRSDNDMYDLNMDEPISAEYSEPARVGDGYSGYGRQRDGRMILDRRAKANLFDLNREKKIIAARGRDRSGLEAFRDAVLAWGKAQGYPAKTENGVKGAYARYKALGPAQRASALASVGYRKLGKPELTDAQKAEAKRRAAERKRDKAQAGFLSTNQVRRAQVQNATYPDAVREWEQINGPKPNPGKIKKEQRPMTQAEKDKAADFMRFWQRKVSASYQKGPKESPADRMAALRSQYGIKIDPKIFKMFKPLRIPKTSQVLNNLVAYTMARSARFHDENGQPFLNESAMRAAYSDNVLAKWQQKHTKSTTSGLRSAVVTDLIANGTLTAGERTVGQDGSVKTTGDYYLSTATNAKTGKKTQRRVLTKQGTAKVAGAMKQL